MAQVQQHLGTYNKIMLATQAINHMAFSIDSVLKEYRRIDSVSGDDVTKEGIETKEKVLNEQLERLKVIMNDLGDYMSGVDCIAPIDVKITNAAFDIVVWGNDHVENEELLLK